MVIAVCLSAAALAGCGGGSVLRGLPTKAELIPLSAMPAGWAAESGSKADSKQTICGIKPDPAPTLAVAYQGPVGVDEVVEGLASGSYFQTISPKLLSCRQTSISGQTFAVSRMAAEKVGQHTVGVTGLARINGYPIGLDLIVFELHAQTFLVATLAPYGSQLDAQARQYARKAADYSR